MFHRCACAILAAAAVCGAAVADDNPKAVADGVWLIAGAVPLKGQPDGNTIIFAAPGGLIVMDTGRHKAHRQAILDFAKAQARPIAAIVNSHWHLDHVSGNPDLRAAYPGLRVYASNAIDDALAGFLARYAAQAEAILDAGKLSPEAAADVRGDLQTIANGAALKPDVVIGKSSMRRIAGKLLAVNLAPDAATAGDVWLFDPKSRVLASGDLVTLPVPFLDTACPAGWSAALARIAKTPFATLIPGHGLPMTRADFATYRRAFDGFIACSASTQNATQCAAAWAASVEALPGADPAASTREQAMAVYYTQNVLRAHGGKSADCKA